MRASPFLLHGSRRLHHKRHLATAGRRRGRMAGVFTEVAPLAAVVMAASFGATYLTHRAWRALRRNPKRAGKGAPSPASRAQRARSLPSVRATAEVEAPPGGPARSVTWDEIPGARSASAPSVPAPFLPRPTAAHDAPAMPAGFPGAPRGVGAAEWEALVRDVVREEGILAENRSRLSRRRSLVSLLANIRDRELLYERGTKIGSAIHSTTYGALSQKLADNHVCSEARFRKGVGDTLLARVVGTVMAREAPVIGAPVCFIEAGLIAGALSNLEGVEYKVREAKCCVAGDPFCEFVAERVAEADPKPSLYDAPAPALTAAAPAGGRAT